MAEKDSTVPDEYLGADHSGVGVEALDVAGRERFIMVYDDVWNALKGTIDLSVYMAIKRRANPDRPEWFGHRADLAREAGVSVNTFDRSIERLEAKGLVVVVHRYVPKGWDRNPSKIAFARDKEHNRQIGNLYRIRFHLPAHATDLSPILGKGEPLPNLTPTQEWGDPLPTVGGDPSPILGNRHRYPDGRDQTGRDTNTPDGVNESEGIDELIPLPDSSPAQDQASKPKRNAYSPEFEMFWQAYPKVGRQAKKTAYTAWQNALKSAEAVDIIAGAHRYANDPNRDDAFTKYAQGWLNAGRWDDEALPPRRNQSGGNGGAAPAGHRPLNAADRKHLTTMLMIEDSPQVRQILDSGYIPLGRSIPDADAPQQNSMIDDARQWAIGA